MNRQDESPRSRGDRAEIARRSRVRPPQAKTVVQRLLQRDPALRMSAAELISEPWVLGRDVPGEPMPATHERLLAFTKVSHFMMNHSLIVDRSNDYA